MFEDILTWGFAILFTVIGAGMFVHLGIMAARWPAARGRVVGNIADHRGSEDGTAAFFPEIAFTARDGREYRIRGDVGRSREWPVGQMVDLRYRAGNPSHTTTLAGWQRIMISLAFLALGLLCWSAVLGLVD